MRTLAATMAIALLLCGCVASGQQFKLEAKPESNRALLYVYRPATIIGIGNPDVPFIWMGVGSDESASGGIWLFPSRLGGTS